MAIVFNMSLLINALRVAGFSISCDLLTTIDELHRVQNLGLVSYNSEDDTWSVSTFLKKRLAGADALKFDTRAAIDLCIIYVADDLKPDEQERFVDLVYYIMIAEPVQNSTFQASNRGNFEG